MNKTNIKKCCISIAKYDKKVNGVNEKTLFTFPYCSDKAMEKYGELVDKGLPVYLWSYYNYESYVHAETDAYRTECRKTKD